MAKKINRCVIEIAPPRYRAHCDALPFTGCSYFLPRREDDPECDCRFYRVRDYECMNSYACREKAEAIVEKLLEKFVRAKKQ
jgi:hypothetical protein